jgi:hypothetical protein
MSGAPAPQHLAAPEEGEPRAGPAAAHKPR